MKQGVVAHHPWKSEGFGSSRLWEQSWSQQLFSKQAAGGNAFIPDAVSPWKEEENVISGKGQQEISWVSFLCHPPSLSPAPAIHVEPGAECRNQLGKVGKALGCIREYPESGKKWNEACLIPLPRPHCCVVPSGARIQTHSSPSFLEED